MILKIDCTEHNKATFALGEKKFTKKTYYLPPGQSFHTLQKLEEFLKWQKVRPKEIKRIVVNAGPGSYTGVRTSVAFAQSLAWAWHIPLQALDKTKFKI